MTGQERLDFAEMRREIREGFREVRDEIQTMASRIQSLELTRAETLAVAADRELAKAAYAAATEQHLKMGDRRGLFISQRVAWLGAISAVIYGAIRLAHDLRVF